MSGPFGKSSDRKLIERIARADKAAMQALFARYHLRTYRFVMRMVESETAARKLANEVFLDVWRSAARFDKSAAVSTTMMSMAYAGASSYLQQQKEQLPKPEDKNDAPPPDRKEKPGQGRENSLRRAIDSLRPGHKAIIDLVYYHECSVLETARILDIAPNTVKTRMLRARKHLAARLRQAGVERSWP